MAKKNAVWGIDIGQCALKALRCTTGDDGEIVADKYDYIEYPKILSQPEADPEELIQEALTEFLSRNQVVGDKVAVSVSGQAGLSRFFKPPPVEVKTLPDIVKYEVKQQIPFPIEDVIWDWQQLGGTIVDGRAVDAEVGLFAMKRDAVYRALRPFDNVEVEVDVVQLSPLSIFNVVCHDTIDELPNPDEFDPENPPESIVVMSMGTDTTDLIVTNGIKLWLRNIPIGGNHFTKQLSREMKLTQTKAEHLKRNARQAEDPRAIFKAMRPVFNDLVNEVQRSLTFFQSMEKSAKLSQIVLQGNAAKLPGLRQFLSKQLEMDIAKVSEFKKLSGSGVTNQPTFSDNVLSFVSCYGLCIQGLKKSQINTNLLPQEIVVERIIRAKKPWVLASCGILILGLALGMFFKTQAWWRVNPEFTDSDGVPWKKAFTEVKNQDTISKGFINSDTEMKNNLDNFKKIAKELSSSSENKSAWLDVYAALTQALPEDERIKALKDEGSVNVNPVDIGFEDRKELYVDFIESVYFADLQTWYAGVAPIHNQMFKTLDDNAESADGGAADATVDVSTDGDGTGPLAGKAGWVIEIKGHHFHNSTKQISLENAGRTFVLNTLIKDLLEKEDVVMPTEDENKLFSYADIGITFPTLTVSSELTSKTIIFDPTSQDDPTAGKSGGSGLDGSGPGAGISGQGLGGLGGLGGGGAGQANGENTFSVQEYNFVIQMAWTPRSDQERIEARAQRLKAKAEAEEKAKAAAEAAAENQQESAQ